MSVSEPAQAVKAAPGDWWPGLVAIACTMAYVVALLAAERQNVIIALLAAGIVVVIVAARLRLFEPVTDLSLRTRTAWVLRRLPPRSS